MRHLRHLLLTSAVAALLPGAAVAESLADALVKAYQTSPLLESNRAALRGLDESVPQARAQRRPQVGVGVSGSSEANVIEDPDEQLTVLQAALNAQLVLYDHGQTRAAIESARNTIAAGRADLKDVEQLVLFNAVAAYVDVLQNQEFVRLANNDVDRLNETLRATRDRFEVGEVTRTDVSQGESRLAASRSTLETAEGEVEIARQAYRVAVGTLPQNLEPAPPLPQLPGSLEDATRIGIERNPAIVAAQFAERAAVYDFDRARAAKGPSVTVSASAGGERNNRPINQNSVIPVDEGTPWDGEAFASIAIDGNLPLYTGGLNDSIVRQAQALLDQRRYELQDEARTVTEAVANAWTQLDVARASIIARREQVEAARIAAEGVAEEARLGARSTLDVLDADQERLQAEAEVVR
ncbi:MAG TPA: TolC family outer membrane protein, partial [Amaricoccus sp.]|nr:TolC family outer membrane protein [Amaricoccus sp.]